MNAYATILGRYTGMKASILSRFARNFPDADPDWRDYLAEVEYCKAVVATELGAGSFEDWCRQDCEKATAARFKPASLNDFELPYAGLV